MFDELLYCVMEIKRAQNDTYTYTPYYLTDTDPKEARLKGESKYYDVLADAAVSSYKEHSAILISGSGFPVMHKCYKHPATT